MRLPLIVILLSCAISATTVEAPGTPAPTAAATPGEVQQAITSSMRQDPGLWSDFDLDGNGKVSQIEVIASLARRPAWMRDHFPEFFRRIDLDHDNAISFSELAAFAAAADAPEFTIAQRAPSVRGEALPGAIAGAGFSVGSGENQASASFVHQQAYIAGYNVVGGQYEPIIGVLGYGTVLDVGDVVITIVHHHL